jgi:hypothetical protein
VTVDYKGHYMVCMMAEHFFCVLTLVPAQKFVKGMLEALARVCGAGLPRLREIHFVLDSPRTVNACGFQNLIFFCMEDVYIPPGIILRAYDLRPPTPAFTWSQAGVVLEYGDLTVDKRFITTHATRFWKQNLGKTNDVTMADVIIDLPDARILMQWGISVAQRLVFRRTNIVLDVPSTPAQSWVAYWELVRAQNKNLEELVVEECGYVHRDADGKSFIPADDVPPLVLERDADALRALRAAIVSRARSRSPQRT